MPIDGPVPKHRRAHRIGGWLPRDPKIIRNYVNDVVKEVKEQKAAGEFQGLTDEVGELRKLIQSNSVVNMLFQAMLTEVPLKPQYANDPDNRPEIYDINPLLEALSHQLRKPIRYNDSAQIGTPINAILAWPMATPSGFTAFLRDDVNQCFQQMLNTWGEYLKTKPSRETVTTEEGGWLSRHAQTDPNSPGLHKFLETYQVPDPEDPVHYGFQSWDQFFTRQFLKGLRPVDSPDKSWVITSAAEATPFAIQYNVQLQDTFWAKDQRYSLLDMLSDRQMAENFVGGTVYQAFLSADSYHNWHAPVKGKYHGQPQVLSGTYYSEPVVYGFPNPDIGADAKSQGYISCVAKRGVAFIEADDPKIGLIALVFVGMAEVSSIEFDQKEHFDKGEQIGRFHFGGSTHCVIFGPNVQFTPEHKAIPRDPAHLGYLDQEPIKVCSAIGTLRSVSSWT